MSSSLLEGVLVLHQFQTISVTVVVCTAAALSGFKGETCTFKGIHIPPDSLDKKLALLVTKMHIK
jgi:hypothetical protein